MKIRNALSSLAVATFVLAGALVAAPAASADITETPGTGPSQSDMQIREELQELAQTQTPEEVQALIDSGEPVELYYDVELHEFTAAMLSDAEPVTARAITGKCINNPANLYQYLGTKQTIKCFDGTGLLTGSWPRAFKHTAGGYTTVMYYYVGGLEYTLYAAPNQTINYSSEVTITKIRRG